METKVMARRMLSGFVAFLEMMLGVKINLEIKSITKVGEAPANPDAEESAAVAPVEELADDAAAPVAEEPVVEEVAPVVEPTDDAAAPANEELPVEEPAPDASAPAEEPAADADAPKTET